MNRLWQLGSLLPAVMIAAVLFDVGARFVPLDWLSYHTFEPALRQWHTSIGPFEPGKVTEKDYAYGDLAALGNLHSVREYRHQELRADQLGYRNSPVLDRAGYGGIVFGDSFILGIDEPEELTLPGQLTKLAGAHYYNAGTALFPRLDHVNEIAAHLKLSSGVAVYELLERRAGQLPPPLRTLEGPAPAPSPPNDAPLVFMGQIDRLVNVTSDLRSRFPSPGRILSQKILKQIQNDVILPNPHASRVVRQTLNNQDEMLFLHSDLDPIPDVDMLSTRWCSYLTTFRDRLAERDLKVIVLIVPNKYTVYAPFSQTGLQDPPGVHLLQSIVNKLRDAHVPVVNVTPAFRTEAAAALPHHEYLYWRDDSHWNTRAIRIAAKLVWLQIQEVDARHARKSSDR